MKKYYLDKEYVFNINNMIFTIEKSGNVILKANNANYSHSDITSTLLEFYCLCLDNNIQYIILHDDKYSYKNRNRYDNILKRLYQQCSIEQKLMLSKVFVLPFDEDLLLKLY